MTEDFRIFLSCDLGVPHLDRQPLNTAYGIVMAFPIPEGSPHTGHREYFDVHILMVLHFADGSAPKSGRLAFVVHFCINRGSENFGAFTDAGITVVNTPDGVRRSVADSTTPFMPALTGNPMIWNQLTPDAEVGFAERSDCLGVGLVGQTVRALGIGSIGRRIVSDGVAFRDKVRCS